MPRAKSKLSSNKQSDKNELEFFSHEPDRLDEMVEGNPISENNPQVRGGRTGSRAVAVQALYESDSSGHPALATVKRLAKEQELTIDDIDFASRLVNMCENQREHLDSLISKIASQYPSEQMPLVERNILRVAIAELEMSDAAPESVIANEAVELARLFGSNSSPKFINGVLGALLG
ncbi:MAG: transcription antitermination factor NusB [SAR202 cluster bacterium]|nr:transcription antitermination factor NusB [SAR202 cluster bacterium]|tara:strand:- start:91 stop:621 length:531 start_codon:yes stop_codon:yes gene_type:complete